MAIFYFSFTFFYFVCSSFVLKILFGMVSTNLVLVGNENYFLGFRTLFSCCLSNKLVLKYYAISIFNFGGELSLTVDYFTGDFLFSTGDFLLES
jgi:hypothetical protein